MWYILYFVLTTSGFIVSVWIQFYPYDFITIPTVYYMTYPVGIIQDSVPIICLNACLTIFITVPVFHCCKPAVEYDIMCRDRKVMELMEKHAVFDIKWCKDKLKELALKLYRCWFCSIRLWLKCLTLLIVTICYLPLAAINKHKYSREFMRDVIGKADVMACRLFHIFHCESKQLSYKNLMSKAALYMIAVLYCLTTMGFTLVFLQLMVRVSLTYTAFFAIHSKYFLAYVGPALPFIYFSVQTIQTYAQNKIKLSEDVLKLRDEIDAGVEDCLHANEGSMKIVYTVTSDSIDLDLPIRLENLREIIEDKFTLLRMEHNIKSRNKQQSLYVHFKEQGIDDKGNKIFDIYFSRFNDHLHDLREKINEELSHQQEDLLRLKLKPFYYELEDASCDEIDIGIPIEFYNYLYYRAPGLALNVHNLLLRLPTIAGIGFFFFTAMSSFHDVGSITVVTSALSGTLLSFVGMRIGLSQFSINNLEEPKRQEIIKQYIIDYITGYTFFDTSRKTIRSFKMVSTSLNPMLDYNRESYIKHSNTLVLTAV